MRLLLDEPGAEDVASILEGDQPVALPFMALMEIRYVLMRKLPLDQIEQLMAILLATGVQVPESDPTWGERAARVKAPGGLSTADAWMAALALLQRAVLVHSDAEFDSVAGLEHHRLARPVKS
jgi:predicted nucleic acid-binding protein